MNNCSFIGRLTAEPELKTTQSGLSVCSFTLAVPRPKVKDKTDFIRFVAWRQTAEFITKYFHKGNRIAIAGTLTSRSYEKDGKTLTINEVVVEDADFCESKGNSANNAAVDAYADAMAQFEPDDGDLPF